MNCEMKKSITASLNVPTMLTGAKNVDAHDGMFILVNTTPGRQLSLLNLDFFALLPTPS
jgi:hypothetical protein